MGPQNCNPPLRTDLVIETISNTQPTDQESKEEANNQPIRYT